MTLREQISAKHGKAEQHRFVRLLLSDGMTSDVYADYLGNQLLCYEALESLAQRHNLLVGLEAVLRVPLMRDDVTELGRAARIFPSTKAYVAYLDTISATQLMAHVYVRHFADLYGGQIIKKVAPGGCRTYAFDDRAALIEKLRAVLSDEMGDEANRCFDFVTHLFDEVADAHNL